MLEPFLKGVDMVVLDNIATLCRTGKENEAQSWQTMQAWLLELRRRGMAVLLIHHAGKSGDQRGTSAREDIMDTVISLRRPREYSMAEGARFEVHLTKARGIVGDDARPFEANLITEGNALHWRIRELEDVELAELKRLLAEGYSIRDCAEEMGKSKAAEKLTCLRAGVPLYQSLRGGTAIHLPNKRPDMSGNVRRGLLRLYRYNGKSVPLCSRLKPVRIRDTRKSDHVLSRPPYGQVQERGRQRHSEPQSPGTREPFQPGSTISAAATITNCTTRPRQTMRRPFSGALTICR